MEEEVAAKVTRLRRRLSVEADDTKSPAPSTPTKKRGGRLAAKPQLELIDENATEAVPKRTRKSTIKDIAEPADEKTVTPSRRSTRIRSSTSILSDTQTGDTVDEKPMTPARRSARIRSNTSLVSEATQSYDSPRAKRAARRISQAGSDTETSSTPGRQTRRTRKDSTSSIDKAELTTAKVGSPIKEVIVEEAEGHVKETNNNNTSKHDALKKSPRLTEKGPRKSTALDNDNKENQPQRDIDSGTIDIDINMEFENQVDSIENSVSSSAVSVDSKPEEMDSKNPDLRNLSITSAKLIEQMDPENKKGMSKMNKTTPIVEESKEFKSKRHRTKSWTTISVPVTNDGSFYSDSEVGKKKNKKASNNFNLSNNIGSGDGILNSSSQMNTGREDPQENLICLNTSNVSAKKKKRLSERSLTNNEADESYNITGKAKDVEKILTEINDDTQEPDTVAVTNNLSGAEKLFEGTPSGIVQALVYIEDSDSNTESIGKANTDKLLNGDDQCVPVIEHQLEEETTKQPKNDSCEPMDIDETIPENSSIIISAEKDISIKPENQGKEGKRKSSICIPNQDDNNSKILNKSKRKSSIGNSESQILDKTDNENKSTLVLSQIKDVSTNEETVSINSAKNIVNSNEPLSKSFNVNESDKKKDEKGNLSLTYSTSTPLQQKSLKKLGMQINTSIITPNNKNKKEEAVAKPKDDIAVLSQNDESNSADESDGRESETSEEHSKLIIDEAEEASDDYESGDSRDEEERQYEEDHEIKEKGETLNSNDEDDYSSDSDYEKGSFIVSSDEEDDNLLSGTDDDLDMSDDELTMSAKSKKKYNERKVKEQKRASREMFQARHKIDDSDKSIKPNKSKSKKANRLESSDSEDDAKIEKKKNRRQRIDSSQDISVDVDKSLLKNKKKKARRLSDSMCEDDATSEKEMTVYEENKKDNNDPLSVPNVIKEEPKTPLKGLDISTIQVTNIEEVEEIHVDENMSMTKVDETSDPLQATALQNDEGDEDDSDVYSISENEEITQNYDSLLNNLNKSKSKQIKTLDISLNINKKEKQKAKDPVLDQLNLTQTKKSKKKTNSKTSNSPEHKVTNESINKHGIKMDSHNEDSSDSIDMKLLFPEDSNDSEILSSQRQNEAIKELADKDDDTTAIVKDFIPLKRTEAKTNILEGIDLSSDVLKLNVSKKKNKKPKLSQTEYSASKGNEENNDVSFFIDTTGTHIDEDESNTLNKSSGKKNKSKRNSTSVTNIDDYDNTVTNADKTELNVSVQNSSKKNKEKKKASLANNTMELKIDGISNEDNNKSGSNSSVVNIEATDAIANDPGIRIKDNSNNKAQKNTSILDAEETKDINIAEEDTSVVHSAKKNKKKIKKAADAEQAEILELDTSSKVNAKKNKQNDSLVAAGVDVSIENSAKKNKKKSLSLVNAEEISLDIPVDKITDDAEINEPIVENAKKKKNKKSLDTSNTNIETHEVDEIDGVIKKSVDISLTSEGSNKKKKKRVSESKITETSEEIHVVIDVDKSQKRKRKWSANQNVEEVVIKDDDPKDSDTLELINVANTTGSQKKKRKVSHSNAEVAPKNEDPIEDIQEEIAVKKTIKKNRNKQTNVDTDQDVSLTTKKDADLINAEDQLSETKKVNKKRKLRDDEDEGKSSKIIKQNSFDKVHVPRLPADVLNLLDDKPKHAVVNKKKIISTTPFLVEETLKRRNKPSNYLEQSVYLNDTSEVKKKKGSIKTPKVLPFIPTASTSDSGFTTNFRIKVIEEQPVFAQSDDVVNFKDRYLHNKKIKKLGTYEKYKKQRNVKLSKF